MPFIGKLVGLVLGFLFGRVFGALLGLWLGHQVDKRLAEQHSSGWQPFSAGGDLSSRQALFFHATFAVMGHLAKSKGRVTTAEIQLASALMSRMGLHGRAREAAQDAFRQGKASDFPLQQILREFRRSCFGRRDLLQIFLEFQLQAAFADGHLDPAERRVLHTIAHELGFSQAQLERLLQMMEAEFRFHRQPGGPATASGRADRLAGAYALLGVSADVSDQQLKRAYRKLMNQHHPDKLVSKGLPPEMMELAKQKAQDIQQAYQLIKQARAQAAA